MKSKNLRLWSWLIVVTLLFGIAGCGATPAPEATQAPEAPEGEATREPAAEAPTAAAPAEGEEATEVFKLGVLAPLSGASARTGDEFRAAATMAFDAIDWQIGKYKIEPVWIDSQGDPAKGAQAYEQAIIQDGIQAAILNWHSSVAVSCMEIAAKHKVPHFAPYGATEVVNETWLSDPEKYYYWVNKWWPTPEKLTQLYVDALEDAVATGALTGNKTVAIYGEDTDWGRSFGGAIKGQLEAVGWETVAEEYFSIDQTEFYPLLNKLKDLNPAVIAGTSTALPSYSALIKQADEVGLESLIVADGLGWFGEWYESTGGASNYVLDQIPGWATDAGKAFAEEFEAQNGFPPSPSAAGLAFDGTNFFIEAAKKVYEAEGELTSENLAAFAKDEIQTGKWSYTGGIVMNEYKYTPETAPDPITGKGYYIFPVLQYFDGVGKIIYPPEWAEQKLAPRGTEPEVLTPSGEALPEQEPVEATEVFKLGVLGPFSGPTARTGDEFKGAVQTAFEAIDYQIGPYKVELVWIDSQSDPAKASQAYEQAIVQEGIQAAILNWHSSVVVACMEIAAKHEVPHFFGFGATEVVNETYASDPEKYSYWMGKTWPSPEKLSIAYVQALEYYIQEGLWTPEAKTVIVWGEDTDWGRSFGGAIKRQFEDVGWEVLSEEYFPIDQTEYYGLLNRVNDLNPAVFAGTAAAPPAISSLVKQADEIGLESVLIADALGWVGEWYDLTGASSDYVLDQIPSWATDDAKKWAADFETRYGIKPSPSAAGQSFDMTNFFIKLANRTLEKHGTLSSETLYEVGQSELWAGQLVYEGGLIHKRYEYNAETIPDPVVGEGYFTFPVLQYFDGVGKIIYPSEWAEQEFEPKP